MPSACVTGVDGQRFGDARTQRRLQLLTRLTAAGTRSWITVNDTGSMSPLVRSGTRALVRWGAWPLAPGDLVVVRHCDDHVAVLHRVCAASAACLWEVPDNLDEPLTRVARLVPRHEVYGRVEALRREGSTKILRLDSTVVRLLGRMQVRLARVLTSPVLSTRGGRALTAYRRLLAVTSALQWAMAR